MASYAQVSDVLALFPRFQVNLPLGVTNTIIQNWLNEGKAEIRSRFLRRNLDPDNPQTLGWSPPLTELTADQAAVLSKFNMAYAIVKLGMVLYTEMSEHELSIVKRFEEEWTSMIYDTDGESKKYILSNDGVYDTLFTPTAAHVQVQPLFAGIAGADYDPREVNNHTMGTHFFFERGKVF